jgi:hypothetical protein
MQNQDLSKVEERVRRYWYNDGLGELACGSLIFLIGIYLAGHVWLPKGSLGRTALDGGLIIFLASGVLAARWLVNVIKIHVTYPRTGYVAYHSDHKSPWGIPLWIGVIAIALVFLLTPIREQAGLLGWLPVLSGLLIGVIFLVWASISGLKRLFVLGLFSISLGAALPLSGLVTGYNLALLCAVVGLAAILSGALTLHRYLRDNPMPAEAGHES